MVRRAERACDGGTILPIPRGIDPISGLRSFSQRIRQAVPDTLFSVNGAAQGVSHALRLRWAKVVPKRHQSWFSPEKTNFDAKGIPL